MRECEKEAKNNGFEECALIVESTNSKARSLYKKMGYRVAKTLKDQNALKMQSDGKARVVKVTTLLMRKSLLNQRQSIDLESFVVPIGAVVALYALSANDDLRDAIFGFRHFEIVSREEQHRDDELEIIESVHTVVIFICFNIYNYVVNIHLSEAIIPRSSCL